MWATLGLWLLGASSIAAQNIRYSFEQNQDNPLRITAVAIPNFSSNNVTLSTAIFSFSISSSIEIASVIDVVPASGEFESHNGSWSVQRITPEVYGGAGLNTSDLMGNDIYQVVMQNSPELDQVFEGVAIPLFSFELANDCQEGAVEILTNDGPIRGAIYESLSANFNNQMSVSIDDAPAIDLYDEKDPFGALIECPLLMVSNHTLTDVEPSLRIQPNPAAARTLAIIESNVAGMGDIILYDVQQREVLRRRELFGTGTNTIALDIEHLPSGSYLLVSQIEDLILKTKLIKTDQ